jgi:hypothetical protein
MLYEGSELVLEVWMIQDGDYSTEAENLSSVNPKPPWEVWPTPG